ncbi:MAG: YebC/PmpR family DNA-binding transcriptional regulator [Acidobacteria bacterium]|nr:YebC/PmpR family DNA-binding transcriptional regulator [Acidobacteriota bacterium]MBV9476843.1 YebC/PmpR family DNA-binding transcriptional regulator [Acidobacteriota bacterium]
MSGHSKWSTIKHKKGAADAKRGKVFTRIIKEMTVAARLGGGDPEANPRLRAAVAEAKANNMPKDNIERAIKRGTGELEGATYEEITYEGYGPGGVAIIVEALTDNTNRTTPEIRHMFEKHGGNLGTPGSVRFQFEKKGYFAVEKSAVGEDKLMEIALEAGADDLQTDDAEVFEIYTAPENFEAVRQALESNKIATVEAKLGMIPANYVAVDEQKSKQIMRLLEMLDDHDDTQNVWSNFDIPAEMMETA